MRNNPNVAVSVNYDVVSLSSSSEFKCNLQTIIMRNDGGPVGQYYLFSHVNILNGHGVMDKSDKSAGTYYPEGQVPRFSHGWLNIFGSYGYPHYDWVDHRW